MKRHGLLIPSTFLAAVLILAMTACSSITPNAGTNNSAIQTDSSMSSAPATPLSTASIVLKVSHPDNDTSMLENTWNCYARTFKNSLEIYSNGEMTCELFPNDQLGDLTSCMEQCSQGVVDVCLSPATGNLASWVPNINVFDIPYIVGNIDACNLVCEGDIYRELSAQLEKAADMRLLSMFQTGFRNIDTWTAPVYSVGDLAGMKLRIQEIDAHIAMASAWKAVPTTVSFSELYSAATTGVIDGFENCNYTLFMKNLYETVNYITETQHLANVVCTLISGQVYNGLTPEQQAAVDRAAADARRATIGVVAANDVNVIAKLKNNGTEIITLSDEEKAAFKEACYEPCKETVLKTVDEDFYNRFLASYAEAETILGIVKTE